MSSYAIHRSMSEGGMVITLVHSQGGMILNRAAGRLSRQERQHVVAYTFGSATLIRPQVFRNAENYVSKKDGVPLFDFFDYIRRRFGNSKNTTFFDSKATFGLDHSWDKAYQRHVNQVLMEIDKTYGGTLR